MSGGRWERQPNGDYEYFTDEELAERAAEEWADDVSVWAGSLLVLGPIGIFYDWGFYFACAETVVGIIGLFFYPKRVLKVVLVWIGVIGLVWYIINKSKG